jgi:putative hydrolase of the HAD superfamily
VFFDVDFTLIFPGPALQATGYQQFCSRHGIVVDPTRFDAATTASAHILEVVDEPAYSDDLFVQYTASIIEQMGGRGPAVTTAAREIYQQWASNHHFEMYDDVTPALARLASRGLALGIISNSHRRLDEFRAHFALQHWIRAAVSSAEHGLMKPHRSIFEVALAQVGVDADAAVMVGDSLKADVEGALAAGMRAVWLRRSGDAPVAAPKGVPVIQSLAELDGVLLGATGWRGVE